MSKRTPGPWQASEGSDGERTVVRAADLFYVLRVDGNCGQTRGQREANARAIAELPNLIAALERARFALDNLSSYTALPDTAIDFINREDEKIRAALAKVGD